MKLKAKIGSIATITSMVVCVIVLTISAVMFVLSANQQRTNASLTVNYVATNVYVEVDAKYQCKEDATPTGLSGGPLTFEATSASTTGTLAAGDIVLSPTNNYVLFTYSFRNKATSGAYDIMVSMSDNVNKTNTKVYYAYNDTSTAMSTMASTMTSTRTTTAPQNMSVPAQQTKYMYVYVEINDPYFGASYTSDASHFISFDIHNTNFVASMLDDYQQVEYLESTGTQYIDTGFTQTSLMTIDCDIENTSPSYNYLFGGSQYDAGRGVNVYNGLYYNNTLEYNYGLNGGYIAYTAASRVFMTQVLTDNNTKMTATINGESFTCNVGTALASEVRVFAASTTTGYRRIYSGMKLYMFKIYDAGTIVRDFIPCYRKSDNVAGLYDVCTNTFFTNQGTGSFTCGADLNVPREYTEVEYIESTGEQYIDTGVVPSADTGMEIDFISTAASISGATAFFGTSKALEDYSCNTFYLNGYSGGTFAIGNNVYDSVPINQNVRNNFSFKNNTFTRTDGSTFTLSSNAWDSSMTFTIYLFGINSGGNIQRRSSMKLYSFKLYKSNTPARDFVPCYRNSDHEAGLYDTVEGKFYTNQGTGSFQKGLDVSAMSTYQQVDYIESTGEQYIDTGVLPYKYMKAYADYTAVAGSSEGSADVISFGAGDGATRSCGLPGHNANYMWYTQGGAEFVYKQNNPTYSAGSRYKITSELTPTTMSITVNGNYASRNATTDVDFPYTIYAFASNHAGTVKYKCSIKLHSYVMWRDGAIARDFVPVYRKSDNEAGLYDTVNKKFYTNSGTGDFVLPS